MAACLGLDEGQSRVDLHGLSSAEARAAVLCVLSSVQQRAAAGGPLTSDLVFITGQSGPSLYFPLLVNVQSAA